MQAIDPAVATAMSLGVAVLLSTLYAVYLKARKGDYSPRYTWLTVVIGVGGTGLIIAARLFLLPLPPFTDAHATLVWAWWMCLFHFIATGTPIIIWQLTQDNVARAEANGRGHMED